MIRAIHGRGRLPIVVGGTGFYFRALTRGLFPGPAADEALRARLERVAARRGDGALHRWLGRVDPPSAARIQPRDRKRMVRALEVYLLTGKPLTAHFDDTASPLPDVDVHAVGAAAAAGAARRAPGPARRCAVRRRARGRGARAAGARRAADGAAVRRARLPADDRVRAGRARARRDARSDRAREPPLRPTPVDLVPQRAYSEVD